MFLGVVFKGYAYTRMVRRFGSMVVYNNSEVFFTLQPRSKDY